MIRLVWFLAVPIMISVQSIGLKSCFGAYSCGVYVAVLIGSDSAFGSLSDAGSFSACGSLSAVGSFSACGSLSAVGSFSAIGSPSATGSFSACGSDSEIYFSKKKLVSSKFFQKDYFNI